MIAAVVASKGDVLCNEPPRFRDFGVTIRAAGEPKAKVDGVAPVKLAKEIGQDRRRRQEQSAALE